MYLKNICGARIQNGGLKDEWIFTQNMVTKAFVFELSGSSFKIRYH